MTLSTAVKGNRVFDALAAIQPKGMSWQGLVTATGLTRPQVMEGIAYCRDVLAGVHAEPIPCIDGIYFLAQNENDALRYLVIRLRTAEKQNKRLLDGTLVPAIAKFGASVPTRFAHRSLQRIVEDLHDLTDFITP